MTGARLLRWRACVLTPRAKPDLVRLPFSVYVRSQSTAAAAFDPEDGATIESIPSQSLTEDILTRLPSPPVSAARTSSKLSALHARLSLPARVPIETLARTLVDPSADSSKKFNNKPFSAFGADLLGYYTSEYIISQYPRLPMPVVFAGMYAYVGPKALSGMAREWGVENVAEPGGEVDPGLLQFRAVAPGTMPDQPTSNIISTAPEGDSNFRRSMSSRVIHDDTFGDLKANKSADLQSGEGPVTYETAGANFVRAVVGAVYLHAGRAAAKNFYHDHFMSRKLDMSKLFQFRNPTRDLSRLCAREGFQAPVARLESETGRKSRHPVFIVGVYSGKDKLGEGVGSSLDEARATAAIAALKGWYLYSPLDIRLPSEMEEPNAKPWAPLLVDQGDVVA